jgi:hypothetical protein
MMKYRYILLFALLVSGCNRSRFVEINGNFPGINYGAFRIKDPDGRLKFSGDINAGQFHLKKLMDSSGYYNLVIIPDATKDEVSAAYDMYLEGGTYTIAASADNGYPQVKSTSKMQNQLSDYYTLTNEKTDKTGGSDALAAFVNAHPQNDIEAHILYKLDYASYPVAFAPIYQKFTDDQKNTPQGQQEGSVLSSLMKLSPGMQAPFLKGNTPDGKPFDASAISKKVILIEFWRSDNQASRLNHKRLLSDYYSPLKVKDLAMVSYSMDTQADVWASAIKEDKMTWTQVSDLKGQDSPNIQAWAINAIPTYDLLDSNWHIIERNVAFDDIPGIVAKYLNQPLN